MRWTLVLTLLLAALTTIDADWYVSNAVGMEGEQIDQRSIDEHEYVLNVERSAGVETRQLLHDGEEIQRVEVVRQGTTTIERTYREGTLETEVVTGDDGQPVSEQIYSGGVLTEHRAYTYEDGRLLRRTVRDAAGELLYRETYGYWRDGALRALVKEEQSSVRTEYRYSDGRLEEEWISRPDSSERFRFDPAGRLVVRERFVDDELVEQEVRRYWGASADSLIREVVISEGESEIRRGYDERGRMISERVEEDGILQRELTREFDGDLLAAEVEDGGGGIRRWDYSYGEDEKLLRIEYREEGVLVEVEHRVLGEQDAPAERMIELYRRGEPILRVYYLGQERLWEDVIQNGEVVRRRELTRPSEESNQ